MVQDKFEDDNDPLTPNTPSSDTGASAGQQQGLPDDMANNDAGTTGRSTRPQQNRLRDKPANNGLTRSERQQVAYAMRTLDQVRPELRMAQDVMRMSGAGNAFRFAAHQMAWAQAAQGPSNLVAIAAESHRRLTNLTAGSQLFLRVAHQRQEWVSRILQSMPVPMAGDMLRTSVGFDTTRVMDLLNKGLGRDLFPTLLQVDRVLADQYGTQPLYNMMSALRRGIGRVTSPYSDVGPMTIAPTRHSRGHAPAPARANGGPPIGLIGRVGADQGAGALMADIRRLSHQHGISEEAVCDIIDTIHRRVGSGGGAGVSAMLISRNIHNEEHRSANRQNYGPQARDVPHAKVYFANGEVTDIYEAEYNKLVTDKGDIDIIIDGCACVVHKRKAKDVPHQRERLTRGEFAIIRDYILHPGWHTPVDILSGASSVEAAYKCFTRARQQSDFELGRHAYLLFETGRADPGELRLYRFNPPKKIKWLLIDRYVAATS